MNDPEESKPGEGTPTSPKKKRVFGPPPVQGLYTGGVQRVAAGEYSLPERQSSSVDPVEGNPFPIESAQHSVWRKATLVAEEKLHRLISRFLETTATTQREFDERAITLTVQKFDIWAERGIQAVWSATSLDVYDRWLSTHAEDWLKQWPPGGHSHSSGFPDELQRFLTSRVEHWKAEARRYLLVQNSRPANGEHKELSHAPSVPRQDGPSEKRPSVAGPNSRKGYRKEIQEWMKRKNLTTVAQAAKHLRISDSTLKSIMSNKGKRRYSDDTLNRILSLIGQKD